jgi:hypothetical protein
MSIDRAVEAHIAEGLPLDEDYARVVAGWWHGGQSSALYAFASSGHAEKWAMERELRERHGDASHAALVRYVATLPEPEEEEL